MGIKMNIAEVKGLKLEELNEKYNKAKQEGKKDVVVEVLREMMDYRLIDRNDDRLKLLLKEGYSERDYRREDEYSAKWFMGKYPKRIKLGLKAEEHEGKRVEGIYEGDTIFPERNMPIVLTEVKCFGQVRNVRENITKLCIESNKAIFNVGGNFESTIMSGGYLVYSISIPSGENFLRHDLGYIIVGRKDTDGDIYSTIIINNRALDICHVNYNKACKVIVGVLNNNLKKLNNCGCHARVV